MNKLEELHRPHSKNWDCYNDAPYKENHTLKSAEITEQIAIEFLQWCISNPEMDGYTSLSKETATYYFNEFLEQRK